MVDFLDEATEIPDDLELKLHVHDEHQEKQRGEKSMQKGNRVVVHHRYIVGKEQQPHTMISTPISPLPFLGVSISNESVLRVKNDLSAA